MLLSDKDLEKAYDALQAQGNKIAPSSEFTDDACLIADDLLSGDCLSFLGEKSESIEFRKGELTVVAGASGHGKSALMGQIALDLASQGRKVCILSLEMPPARTLYRMGRQQEGLAVCGRLPQYRESAADTLEDFLKQIAPFVYLLDRVGSATPKQVFGAIVQSVTKFGCSHIIIDNLMRVCPEYGDRANEAQKNFVQDLIALAKRFDVHIWLVHHVRKGQSETDEINKFSIRGAAAITDNADNVLLLCRNLAKEKKQEKFYRREVDISEADSVLVVAKQRNGDWQGRIPLWFDRTSYRFCPTCARKASRFQFPAIHNGAHA